MRTRLRLAQRPDIVEADPHGRGQGRGVADEPGVREIVRGPGLPRHGPLNRPRQLAGPLLNHVLQHVGDQVRRFLRDHLLRLEKNLFQRLPGRILHRGHRIGLEAIALVGKHRIGGGHLERRDAGGPQGQREVLVDRAGDAQCFGELDHRLDADPFQQLDRGHIMGMDQGFPQADRSVKPPAVILRLPGLFRILLVFVDDGRIHHHGRGAQALVERRGVNDRLERRAGLPARGHHAVVFAAREVVAPDHRPDRSVAGIDRHQPALDDRRLLELEVGRVLFNLLQADLDDIARLEEILDGGQRHGILHRILALEPALGPGHVVERHLSQDGAGLHLDDISTDFHDHALHNLVG